MLSKVVDTSTTERPTSFTQPDHQFITATHRADDYVKLTDIVIS